MDYFTLFEIPKTFFINQELLTKNFYKLQLKFHHDVFLHHSEEVKKIALKKSIRINKGYKILKDFLNRAIYLLYINGIDLKKDMQASENKSFLVKYFFLQEELDFLKKNNFDAKKLCILENKINKKIKKYKKLIELNFINNNYQVVVEIVKKLLFFENIKNNLNTEKDVYLINVNKGKYK